jgi:hypothetical protein
LGKQTCVATNVGEADFVADAANSNAVLEIASGKEIEKAVDQTLSMPESILLALARASAAEGSVNGSLNGPLRRP